MLHTIAKLFTSSHFEQNMLETRTLQGWWRWTEVKRQELQTQREGASLQGTAEAGVKGKDGRAMAEAHRRVAALLLGLAHHEIQGILRNCHQAQGSNTSTELSAHTVEEDEQQATHLSRGGLGRGTAAGNNFQGLSRPTVSWDISGDDGGYGV